MEGEREREREREREGEREREDISEAKKVNRNGDTMKTGHETVEIGSGKSKTDITEVVQEQKQRGSKRGIWLKLGKGTATRKCQNG